MSSVAFRACVPDDFWAVQAHVLALHREDPSSTPGVEMTPRRFERTFQELMGKPDKGRIVAFIKGEEVVGYAILIFFWSNELGGDLVNVDELFVRPLDRGAGIGTAFFEWLKGEWRGKAVALALETSPSNETAARYYARLGFRLHPNVQQLAFLNPVGRPS